MIRWYKIPNQTKVNAYNKIAEETGMSAFAVEKDWWVVQTLSIILNTQIGSSLVFKGGTSLSKAWGLISRFSEDIDLAVDRSFFGYDGDLSRSNRERLRKKTSAYVSETLYPELQGLFKERGLDGVELKIVEAISADQDPRIIEVYYPHVIQTPSYLAPKIQLEIGCRSLREPFEAKMLCSLVDEHFSGMEFVQSAIEVPTVIPQRTFLEKIFLLHEEFHRPLEKIRVHRLSRHLYDVYQLSKTEYANDAINNQELYETIVKHRHHYTRVGGVDYNLHRPQTINPLPIETVAEAWKKDYQTMVEEMIYGDAPSYEDMIDGIGDFVKKLNAIEWQMTCKFTPPA